jgi:hypothetical protein
MAQKYSRILQAARYYSAIDNYIKYITDASKRGQNVGTGKARTASQILYVDPFGISIGAKTVALVSGAKDTWTTRKPNFGTHTKDVLAADSVAVKVNGFRAARVVISTGRTSSGVRKVSKVTGMAYLDYGGKSTSAPFGRKNATETESEAFAEIKTLVLAAVNGALVTLQPEKI